MTETEYDELDKCTCDEEYHEPHLCPFATEIHGDSTLCTCCPFCEDNCMMEN